MKIIFIFIATILLFGFVQNKTQRSNKSNLKKNKDNKKFLSQNEDQQQQDNYNFEKLFNPDQIYQANNNVSYKILDKFKRNEVYYTQGLSFYDSNSSNILLESSGKIGESVLQKINLGDNVSVDKQTYINKQYFGEGSDIIETENGQKIFMLTWKERVVYVYNSELELENTLDLPLKIKEGWGMTHYKNEDDKDMLIISDGSNKLHHVDPENFEVFKTVDVFYNNDKTQQMNLLNELEMYKGYVLSNIYQTNQIAKIDPFTGDNIDLYDFSALQDDMKQAEGYQDQNDFFYRDFCFNGIAYQESSNSFIVTGKKWPWLYKIDFDI